MSDRKYMTNKRQSDMGERGIEYTRHGMDAKKSARVGMAVAFHDEDGQNWGEIIGVYPHVCAVRVSTGGRSRVKCRQWHEIGRMI